MESLPTGHEPSEEVPEPLPIRGFVYPVVREIVRRFVEYDDDFTPPRAIVGGPESESGTE